MKTITASKVTPLHVQAANLGIECNGIVARYKSFAIEQKGGFFIARNGYATIRAWGSLRLIIARIG